MATRNRTTCHSNGRNPNRNPNIEAVETEREHELVTNEPTPPSEPMATTPPADAPASVPAAPASAPAAAEADRPSDEARDDYRESRDRDDRGGGRDDRRESRDRDDRGGDRDDRRGGGGFRRRGCEFCIGHTDVLDYKDVERVRRYVGDRGKMEARRKVGTCAKHQRVVSRAVKRARYMALLPYTSEHIRVTGVPAGGRR